MSKPKPNNQKPAQTGAPVLSSIIYLYCRTLTRRSQSRQEYQRYLVRVVQGLFFLIQLAMRK